MNKILLAATLLSLGGCNAAYNEGLQLLIKANLAKQLFQNEGFYRVINSDAPIIKEALKQIKK